jgi:ubiquinone/menaquinone biosynthesis C-methylase UbiE
MMPTQATITRDHYQAAVTDEAALLNRVGGIVDAMGPGRKSVAELAGLDQFHVGGLMATADFARRIGVEPGSRVLDAGSGLGGPARYLAETFGCEVLGVDLTPSYVAMANLLTERAGLGHLVRCEVGDLTELGLQPAQFDLVWTQHVAMNVRDRKALYTALRRVLKSGGRLAFYDALASDGGSDPLYPTPWAETAEASTLLTEAATRQVLDDCGFRVVQWDDVSHQAIGWLQQQTSTAGPVPGGGAGLVVGPRIVQMAGNFFRNLSEGRLRLVMAACLAS